MSWAGVKWGRVCSRWASGPRAASSVPAKMSGGDGERADAGGPVFAAAGFVAVGAGEPGGEGGAAHAEDVVCGAGADGGVEGELAGIVVDEGLGVLAVGRGIALALAEGGEHLFALGVFHGLGARR